jgi:hypothetical protein
MIHLLEAYQLPEPRRTLRPVAQHFAAMTVSDAPYGCDPYNRNAWDTVRLTQSAAASLSSGFDPTRLQAI